MITRDLGTGYRAGCEGAPPGLDVVSDHAPGNWYPLERPMLRPTPPGPEAIMIPIAAPVGDDPTDPASHTEPRHGSHGMIPWLDAMASVRIGESGRRK